MQIEEIKENYGTGWIKLYRSIADHWLWQKPLSKFEAWVDILISANHSDEKVNLGNEIYICKRGEKLYSLDTWAKRWGWNKSATRRFLSLLQKDSMIELKSNRYTTHLTISNYSNYQDGRNGSETEMKRKWHGSETEVTPIKELKNDKNDKKYEPTPKIKIEERMTEFELELMEYKNEYSPEILKEFWTYWSELDKSRTKMKKELEKTWETKKRLAKWKMNQEKFGVKNGSRSSGSRRKDYVTEDEYREGLKNLYEGRT